MGEGNVRYLLNFFSSPQPSSGGTGEEATSCRSLYGRGRARTRAGEGWAGRGGTIIAILAMTLMPLATMAADVLALEVFGLGLGDDRSTVAEVFPDMVFEPVDYADPVVEYTYEAALGRRAVERLEGRGFKPVPGRSPIEFVARLTGDGLLYELSAWERFDAPIDCAKKMREWRNNYGAPDVQVLEERAQWIERDLGIDRMLDIRCFEEGRVAWQLIDARALADHRAVLRERLRPYVEQVQIRTQGGHP